MKKIAILLFGLLLSNFSYAQFGNLVGAATSAVGGGGGGAGVSAEKIVAGYVNSSKLVISSQQNLLKAAKVKVDSDLYAANIKNLTASVTSDQVAESAKIQTEGSKQIQQAFSDKSLKLDAAGTRNGRISSFDLAYSASAAMPIQIRSLTLISPPYCSKCRSRKACFGSRF
jgi:hypothetical protein